MTWADPATPARPSRIPGRRRRERMTEASRRSPPGRRDAVGAGRPTGGRQRSLAIAALEAAASACGRSTQFDAQTPADTQPTSRARPFCTRDRLLPLRPIDAAQGTVGRVCRADRAIRPRRRPDGPKTRRVQVHRQPPPGRQPGRLFLPSTTESRRHSPLDVWLFDRRFAQHSQGGSCGSSDLTPSNCCMRLWLFGSGSQRSKAERPAPGIPCTQAGGLPSSFTTNSAWL